MLDVWFNTLRVRGGTLQAEEKVKELPKECYEIVRKEFQKVEAYLEEKKAETVEI